MTCTPTPEKIFVSSGTQLNNTEMTPSRTFCIYISNHEYSRNISNVLNLCYINFFLLFSVSAHVPNLKLAWFSQLWPFQSSRHILKGFEMFATDFKSIESVTKYSCMWFLSAHNCIVYISSSESVEMCYFCIETRILEF